MIILMCYTHLFLLYWVGHFWIQFQHWKKMSDLHKSDAAFWVRQNERKYELIQELLSAKKT